MGCRESIKVYQLFINTCIMSPESIFNLAGPIAMAGWFIIIVFPLWRSSDKFIVGIIITLLAIVYAWLIATHFKPADFSKFNSLAGAMELFQNKELFTAGWIHYLAFDLLTGLFIRQNAQRYNISHWLLIPCYLVTSMLGPIGLLLYLVIRLFYSRKYFAGNF